MNAQSIVWVYIVLLVAGGLIGFFKSGSRASIVTSVIFAAGLSVCIAGILDPKLASLGVNILLVVLMIFFGGRFLTTRKFMPAGLMSILTILVLALSNVLKFK